MSSLSKVSAWSVEHVSLSKCLAKWLWRNTDTLSSLRLGGKPLCLCLSDAFYSIGNHLNFNIVLHWLRVLQQHWLQLIAVFLSKEMWLLCATWACERNVCRLQRRAFKNQSVTKSKRFLEVMTRHEPVVRSNGYKHALWNCSMHFVAILNAIKQKHLCK